METEPLKYDDKVLSIQYALAVRQGTEPRKYAPSPRVFEGYFSCSKMEMC